MNKITIGELELNDDYVERLLQQLKGEGVKTQQELAKYLEGYSHTEDFSMKTHLLLSNHKRKQNFALPFDE